MQKHCFLSSFGTLIGSCTLIVTGAMATTKSRIGFLLGYNMKFVIT